MCNKGAYKMLVKRSYNNSVFNGLFCVRPLATRMILNTNTTVNAQENKCLLHMPLKTVPVLLKRSAMCSSLSNIHCQFYCTENRQPMLPKLMDFPEIAWPSIIKTVRNWVLSRFIIMRYFDSEFNLPDFIAGSKKAVSVVSGLLSRGDVNNISGLVSPDIINELKNSLSTFSLTQRQQLAIEEEDIYFSFPYEIGVIFPNENEEGAQQQRFVEITMCYHVLQGLKEMRERGDHIPLNLGMLPEYKDKIYVCNYRFVREYTRGIDGDWTINAMNHFRPADHVN